MPTIEMSLNDLKKYQGCSPRPADFKEFWKKQVDKIKGIKPECKTEKIEMNVDGVECFDLYFKGADGAKIHCKYARPTQEGKFPAVFHFHGYHSHSGDWFDKIALAKLGFHSFTMDSRGQGGLSEDNLQTGGSTLTGHIMKGICEGPENLAFTKIYLDTVYLVELAKSMKNVDSSKLYTFGQSQGGALAVACAALNPEVSKVVSCYPFLSDFKRVLDAPFQMGAYGEINNYFKFSDPLHRREEEIFNTLSYIDIQNFAPDMMCELIFVTALMDQICAPSSQYAFYNKFKGVKTEIVYPQHGHEWIPGFMDIVLKTILG